MSMMVSFVLSFFPRDVLDEILNLIGSVSEGFPSYSSLQSYGPGKNTGGGGILFNPLHTDFIMTHTSPCFAVADDK